jgi:acyl-CoA synthetase (AMP-forming)/AMP-acid ligase II
VVLVSFFSSGSLSGDEADQRYSVFYFSFADRAKDTLKVSGVQVSPVELETVILNHPSGFISDVAVAGISGHGRTEDERVPRAWIVLNHAGREEVRRIKRTGKNGEKEITRMVEDHVKEKLSRVKWLRGGVEIVREASTSLSRLELIVHSFSP